jgi:hypothetical protein
LLQKEYGGVLRERRMPGRFGEVRQRDRKEHGGAKRGFAAVRNGEGNRFRAKRIDNGLVLGRYVDNERYRYGCRRVHCHGFLHRAFVAAVHILDATDYGKLQGARGKSAADSAAAGACIGASEMETQQAECVGRYGHGKQALHFHILLLINSWCANKIP